MILNKFYGLFSNNLAIDIGTANTLVYLEGRGIVVNEPSVVAIQENSRGQRKILAVGTEAKKMVGRTPGSIKAISPLKEGVIADFDITRKMLEYFIGKSRSKRQSFIGPRIIVSVPIGITEVEKRAVKEAAQAAGAREVYLIEDTISGAIGSGLSITEPTGNLVVDIGGGSTSVAVISLAGTVVSTSVKVGGYMFDDSILQYAKRNYNILIGERTAEDVKNKLGQALNGDEPATMLVKGRDLRTGRPMTIELTSDEIKEALSEPVAIIVDSIKQTLERTPPELSADIVDTGITLVGGGALLGGLDKVINEETGLPVNIAPDPLTCVVLGSGKALSQINILKEVSL